jgi:pyrroloquinoline quinone biosynthesis protein B
MAAINCNFAFVLSILLVNGCGSSNDKSAEQSNIRKQAFEASSEGQALLDSAWKQPMLYVLGTLQDGGAPHMGCDRPCCRNLFLRPATDRKVVSLGIADFKSGSGQLAMFEATPDVASQWHALQSLSGLADVLPSIFLTHAHIGHYSGLMFLGREVLGATDIQVHAMPRFRRFLQTNGPWDQLISLGNIVVNQLAEDSIVQVTEQVQTLPIRVPHRDEYSETVGYRIMGPNHSVLFIPDIDKWERWERDLKRELSLVDRAYLDATFFDASEVGYRDMSEIPHPFIVESMDFLGALSAAEKSKVHFIHMNHTNPCLSDTSSAYRHVVASGFNIARMHEAFPL